MKYKVVSDNNFEHQLKLELSNLIASLVINSCHVLRNSSNWKVVFFEPRITPGTTDKMSGYLKIERRPDSGQIINFPRIVVRGENFEMLFESTLREPFHFTVFLEGLPTTKGPTATSRYLDNRLRLSVNFQN